MKKGIKISYKGQIGTSLGKIERYGVEWILVEYMDGTKAIVKEEMLEVIK